MGGNLQTLKRSMGLAAPRAQLTPEQRRLARCARELASQVRAWEKQSRANLNNQHRATFDEWSALHNRGRAALLEGAPVESETLDAVYDAACRLDVLRSRLDEFDQLGPKELISRFRAQRSSLAA